ncbi:hypothetical protein [Nocardioides stalactiti]|uniref:hypothetical protein n=1 Tax=Nocardioides stalactiti TaxID=2755356 RepID=UPI0016012E2B|nr:hypothetical protein [Nocardioides stalactiti]
MFTTPTAPVAGSRVDNLVLATAIVRHAEALLAAAGNSPRALAHIEAAFDAALEITPLSCAAEVRAANEHLLAAEAELARGIRPAV